MLSVGRAARQGVDYEGETSGLPPSPVPAAAEIEAELARLLASDKICRNANSSRFLRYVVEETLAGRGERLKAFSIATQALGRPDDFNPQSDSIVRVQAVRVRAQLEEYYAGPGAENPVRILLPKGSYQPRFEATRPEKPAPIEAEVPTPIFAAAPARSSPPRAAAAAALFVAVFAVLALAAFQLLWEPGDSLARSGPPMLVISAQGAPASGPLQIAADRMLALLTGDAASGEDVRIQRASGANAGSNGDYALEARFTGSGAGVFDVDFALTERRSHDVIWSKAFADLPLDDRARQEAAAHSVAAATVDMGGALLSDFYRRLRQAGLPLTGVYCRLTALNFLLLRQEEGRPAARDCLERQIEREPDDIRSLTLLSTFLVVGYMENYPDNHGDIDVQRALQLARRAYDQKPGGLAALAALFYARFADKRYDDAFAFAPLLMEKNPNSLLVMLRLGRAFVSRGRYEEGVAQLERMEARFGAPQPAATAYLALAALMRDDRDALKRYAGRVTTEATPLGLLLGAIDARMSRDLASLEARLTRLKDQFPRFHANYSAALARYGLTSSILDRLRSEVSQLREMSSELAPKDVAPL